jgi:hypothetical protein
LTAETAIEASVRAARILISPTCRPQGLADT